MRAQLGFWWVRVRAACSFFLLTTGILPLCEGQGDHCLSTCSVICVSSGIVQSDPPIPMDRTLIPSPPPRPKNPVFDDEEKSKVKCIFDLESLDEQSQEECVGRTAEGGYLLSSASEAVSHSSLSWPCTRQLPASVTRAVSCGHEPLYRV